MHTILRISFSDVASRVTGPECVTVADIEVYSLDVHRTELTLFTTTAAQSVTQVPGPFSINKSAKGVPNESLLSSGAIVTRYMQAETECMNVGRTVHMVWCTRRARGTATIL